MIGGLYAAIVALVTLLISSEVAGVVGVTLTTLSTALFRDLDTLLHDRDQGQAGLVIPRISWSLLVLCAAAFVGLQNSLGNILTVGAYTANLSRYMPGATLLTSIGEGVVSCTLGGYLCGRILPTKRYMYPVLATIMGLVVNNAVPLMSVVVSQQRLYGVAGPILATGVYWLIYVFFAALGARYGFKKNKDLALALE
jgi:hypothetical protein